MRIREYLQESISFIVPPLNKEIEELERTAQELHLNFKDLKNKYNSGELINLSLNDWKNMENTDSWETTTLEKVKKFSETYERNWLVLVDAIKKNKAFESPIVLYRQNKAPYLVAGNTRLMCMRALKITPKIYKIGI